MVPPLTRPIFVGGVPRSGTTMVRAILDRHDAIACGPEMRLMSRVCELYRTAREQVGKAAPAGCGLDEDSVRQAFRDFATRLLAPGLALTGKRRLAEKTPSNLLWFDSLRDLFPDCALVHVLRDGRDVVASLLDMDWTDPATGQPYGFVRDAGEAARLWVRMTSAAEAARTRLPIIELRYEAIVTDPLPTLGAFFAALGESWQPQVLDFHRGGRVAAGENEASRDQISRPLHHGSIGRWRERLNAGDRAVVEQIAGDQLARLGYR